MSKSLRKQYVIEMTKNDNITSSLKTFWIEKLFLWLLACEHENVCICFRVRVWLVLLIEIPFCV